LIGWHASRAQAHEAILREGLQVIGEGVYFGLHPAVPASFAECHYGRPYVVYALALPRSGEGAFVWDRDFYLSAREGYAFRTVGAEHILEGAPNDACDRRFVAPGNSGFDRWYPFDGKRNYVGESRLLRGFAGWLDEAALDEQIAALLADPLRDPEGTLLAALYVRWLTEEKQAAFQEVALCATQEVVLRGEGLCDGAFVVALGQWIAGGRWPEPAALERAVRRWPLARLALLLAWRRDGERARALLERVRQVRDDVCYRQLAYIGEGLESPDRWLSLGTSPLWDAELASALVQLAWHGRIASVQCRTLIDAIAQMPAELSDPALLDLLWGIRHVPSRSRNRVRWHLRPRVPRVAQQLQQIAISGQRLARRIASALLKVTG
jgi:hypothetical protein